MKRFKLSMYVISAIVVVIIFIFAVALFLSSRSQKYSEVTKVTCRLKWYEQSQFAGNFVAVAKGFYKDAGIDCELRSGGQDFNAIKLVAAGADDFGIWGADDIIIARAKGIPVVAIAVIYQKSPVCFFAKKGAGINGPKDFIGRKVAMQYGTNVRTEYVAMMNNLGIKLESVQEVPSRFDMQQFFQGKVDVWNGYTINEVLTAEEQLGEMVVIMPSDYGVNIYADCIFTTEEMIKKRPDLVRSFVRATINGWQYALDHPEEAVDIVIAKNPKLRRSHEMEMLLKSKRLILARGAEKRGIGSMSESMWTEMEKTLFVQGIITTRVDVKNAFNASFLP